MISLTFEKENNHWLMSQHHVSVLQIGTEDDFKGFLTKDRIQQKIEDLIAELELNPDSKNEEKGIKEYLVKAKEITISIALHSSE